MNIPVFVSLAVCCHHCSNDVVIPLPVAVVSLVVAVVCCIVLFWKSI